ncbi:hypothetical protein T265_04401 [Opisthorchis viverrini]|uniref:Uncharacterized protein n=1 Tax=Opisthorchis viverrini TaxID=6198 RepID=A0A074ZZX4_OPIVI|nr:hypothetical protein T265_04401 [Opisthorchis viverrini]KER28860.1 hypothetical protein T265_04401 [Opisthorchis viverrini]
MWVSNKPDLEMGMFDIPSGLRRLNRSTKVTADQEEARGFRGKPTSREDIRSGANNPALFVVMTDLQ